jgi:hypothetical protein
VIPRSVYFDDENFSQAPLDDLSELLDEGA